jgi:hypothetical protein
MIDVRGFARSGVRLFNKPERSRWNHREKPPVATVHSAATSLRKTYDTGGETRVSGRTKCALVDYVFQTPAAH